MLPSTLLTTAHPEVRACLSAWIRDPVERPNAVWCGLVSNISMNEWFNLTLWTLKYATCAGCWKFWVNSNGARKCEEQEMATLVLLPGEFHEQRSLVGFSRKELDMTEQLSTCTRVLNAHNDSHEGATVYISLMHIEEGEVERKRTRLCSQAIWLQSPQSSFILNINGLNIPIKRHRGVDGLKNNSYIFCLQETHFKSKDTLRLKAKA